MNCLNCFTPASGRNVVHCKVCNGILHKDCAIKEGGDMYCDNCYTVKESTPHQKIEVPDVIRRSYIDTYKQCPTKFYYEVIKDIPAPQTIYTQLGIDLHELFNQHAQNPRPIEEMKKEFETIFDNYPDELFGEVPKVKIYHRGVNSINNFYLITKNMPKPFKTEHTMQFSVGEDLPKVQCTADRIHLVDGELEIFDYKTGAVMVGQKLSNDIQAPLYIYGARETYGYPVRKFVFLYLDQNKVRVFNRCSSEEYICEVNKRQYHINLTETIRDVQRTFSQIKKGQFNIPRNIKGMFYTCKMCHLREMDICKGAEIQSWKQYNKR